jgi:hypothetical protein
MWSALFWDITQRRVVILYRRFGTTYLSNCCTSWPLKMGPICCPETSVKGHHSTLRNIPEERRSQMISYITKTQCFCVTKTNLLVMFMEVIAVGCEVYVRRNWGHAVGWGTALQTGTSRVRFPMVSLEFFTGTMALGSTQPVTEMSTRNLSWGVKAAGA